MKQRTDVEEVKSAYIGTFTCESRHMPVTPSADSRQQISEDSFT
jgi:hypothetical protein